MNFILFDDETRTCLLPFTFTRPVAGIRIGILTIAEKWEKHLSSSLSFLTGKFLREKFPFEPADENIIINGSILPDTKLVAEILHLKNNEKLVKEHVLIAARVSKDQLSIFESTGNLEAQSSKQYAAELFKINFNWDIFTFNERALNDDYQLLTKGRKSMPLSKTNHVNGVENIFVEEGAVVECAMLNATKGVIYISRNAEIMEGSMIRGPFALGEHSQVKMGSKIYGATTIGPHCKTGGEINNSVLFAYTNKAHEGYLGNSVIGEWCNLGADSNNSNLKNNYSSVKVWNYRDESFMNTGLVHCGLMMGDHSKCSINTMFNTGTVVGVSANIFGSGFPRNFVPSFSWGGAAGFTTYVTKKAFETAKLVMGRRNIEFDEVEASILEHIFEETKKWRKD